MRLSSQDPLPSATEYQGTCILFSVLGCLSLHGRWWTRAQRFPVRSGGFTCPSLTASTCTVVAGDKPCLAQWPSDKTAHNRNGQKPHMYRHKSMAAIWRAVLPRLPTPFFFGLACHSRCCITPH